MAASKIQWSALPCAHRGHDSLYLKHYNYKLVPFAHSQHLQKKRYGASESKLKEVIFIRVCGTELHAEEIIALSIPPSPLHPLSFSLSPCLWITFNLQSKQLWQGLWSFDERQREAGRKWVWGNEAAMSKNDLWTALSFTLPSLRCSQFKYHISQKFNSDHAQSDQCTISRNWIALFV